MKKLLTASLVLFLFGCKKDNELTKENVVGKWKQTAETIDGANSWNTTFHDACEMDDITEFKSDNTFHYNDAGSACTPANHDNGTWSLNGKTLTVDGGQMTVESFDGKTMTVKSTETDNGITYTITASYAKQ